MGLHEGYGPPHRRRFVLTQAALEIEDVLDIPAERWLIFNLDPNVEIRGLSSREDHVYCTLLHKTGVELTLYVDGGDHAEQGEGAFGLGYGRPLSNSNLKIRMSRPMSRTTLTWSL